MTRTTLIALAASALLLCAALPPALAQDGTGSIWWEAEDPASTNFPDSHAFDPANETEASILSENEWIGADGERDEDLFLEYTLNVPAEGDYNFYARKFWLHGPFRWRFDGGEWHNVGRDIALLDNVSMRLHTGANWVHAGQVHLTAGEHMLRIELTERSGAAAFDAFLLTTQPFIPRGKLKPDEKLGRAPEGWFAFEPDLDTFADSPIDLRSLNEEHAGANGWIQARDGQFVHGETNEPVRFWAVNAGPNIVSMDKASVDYLARSLAKRGVNMVRAHGAPFEGSGPNAGAVDEQYIDRLQYFVAAMRREGIYTTLSIYFPLWIQLNESERFPGYEGDAKPFALLFFDPAFQEMYQGWWRELLTRDNPHTGVPLAEDPAVGALEIINEDSYFFWTFVPYERVPSPHIEKLEKLFGDWLAQEYGSIEQALAAWGGGERLRGDAPAEGRVGLKSAGDLVAHRDQKRAQDTARFLTEHQSQFFRDQIAFLKETLGYDGMVYASNWITANADVLGPLDKMSNTVADFMDRHGYYGGPHESPMGYQLNVGDRYDDRTALRFESGQTPDDLTKRSFGTPLADVIYNNLPSTISEIDWPMPNRYRTELPLLAAAYGSLQGSDGFHLFSLAGPSWQNTQTKWPIQVPVTLGQFPAAALMYRQGLIEAAPPVVVVDLNVGDLMALEGSPSIAPVNVDSIRAAELPEGEVGEVAENVNIDPRAFYVGQVRVNFTDDEGKTRLVDLSRYIDEREQTVRSITSQLAWNYDEGLVTIDAPAAQGATGFFSEVGPVQTTDLTIASDMEYGAIALVALDGQPIAESDRMLLQVMSENQNYDWDAPGEGVREIRSLGSAPIVVRNLSGTVSLGRADAGDLKVTALDANGYPTEQVGSADAIELQPTTLYYLIER